MSSPWDRPWPNRAAGGRGAKLRDRFRRLSRRRISRPFATFVIVALVIFAFELMQFLQHRPSEDRMIAVGMREAAYDTPFENCDAARAAGAAPVRRGQSGYGSHLDRDGDGVACEPWP